MLNLDFQPKMIGRHEELEKLQSYLDKAIDGEGSALFVFGEAGIGKTRLVNELKEVAQSRDFQVLIGNSLLESMTPYMPFMEALKSGNMEYLFEEEAPRVEAVYLVTHSGLLIKEMLRKETRLNPDIFASMLTTVGNFVRESLSMLSGKEKEGALNTLGFENYRILIESGKSMNLVVLLTGKENEFLINDMKETFNLMEERYESALVDWDEEKKEITGIEKYLQPLITSGKYDGTYYEKDDPQARRNLLFENISMGLSRQTGTKPTLLCIEDLHWADPSSLALMHYITRNTRKSGLVILGTYRPEDVIAQNGKVHPLIETMQMMDREELYEEIELHRLPEECISEFLFSLLGKNDFSDEFINRIYKETEGNPLFLIQLVKFLVEEKIIENHNGIWKLTKEPDKIDIPSEIYNLIARRLGKVEEEYREVLNYASVIGDVFTSTLLADVMQIKRIQLLEQLRTLEQTHRLIRSYDGKHRFDHAKIRDILYSEIPQDSRREYHATIANSIETKNSDNVDPVIGDLAFHYRLCGNKDKALYYLMKAAHNAKKDYSNEEAIRFYNQALEFEEDDKKRLEIFESLGDIYHLIGEYAKSEKSFNSALELAEEENKKAELNAKIGRISGKKV
ncbi:MAG: AAA family ATPase [Thermoplasmata archaeon]|nr:MAG: AAA family ATPase [Thermoplasmata archaeon]